jgi:hypothetical protein
MLEVYPSHPGLFLFITCFSYLAWSFTEYGRPRANIAILGEAAIIL